LYFAFRELGRVIRTTFLLEYIDDEALRRIIQAAQNKCEGFNQFAQWVYFGDDTITENVRDDQLKIIKYNHLIANFGPYRLSQHVQRLVHSQRFSIDGIVKCN